MTYAKLFEPWGSYKELAGPLRSLGYLTAGRGRGGSLAITPAGLRYLTGDHDAPAEPTPSSPTPLPAPPGGTEPYEDVAGFCAAAKVEQIREHRFVLTPGRYVGSAEIEEDDEPVADKITRLTRELCVAFDESDRLQARVREALRRLDV